MTFAFEAESSDFYNLGENRFVWTKEQKDLSTDRRHATEATPALRRYLNNYFTAAAQRARKVSSAQIFLDKTPSNAFRIPLVAAAFPEAKFIHIIRDGRDNLLSRTRQWKAQEPEESSSSDPMSRPGGKLRFFKSRLATLIQLMRNGSLPADRMPIAFKESLRRQVLPLLTGQPVMYGERIAGLDSLLAKEGLDAAAAVQWRDSVLAAHQDGMALGANRYLELRYEHFIEEPVEHWHSIMAFLNRVPSGAGDNWLTQNVKKRNSQKWIKTEDAERIGRVEHYLRPALERLGYSWNE